MIDKVDMKGLNDIVDQNRVNMMGDRYKLSCENKECNIKILPIC